MDADAAGYYHKKMTHDILLKLKNKIDRYAKRTKNS
jgi:hypothetical protein